MKKLILTLEFPSGSVLIGGVSPSPEGSHKTHASRGGQPYIPATALRGALRQTLEALIRGAEGSGDPASVCAGGSGIPYGPRQPSKVCVLDNGQPCVVCRLFGGQRDGLPANAVSFSALELFDATCQSAPAWTTRPGVGVTRQSRSVEKGRLFMQHVPSRRHLRYVAEGWLKDETLLHALNAAVLATQHIGSGRSRGLARCNLSLEVADAPPSSLPTLPTGDAMTVRLTLKSAAALAVPVRDRNLVQSRSDVPGSTLRGAIGFTLAELLTSRGLDPNADQPFQALVAETGAQFGFLHPAQPELFPHDSAGPLPITALTCKVGGRSHGLADSLLEKIGATLMEKPEQAQRISRSSSKLSTCSQCQQPLRAAKGWRTHEKGPAIRSLTRVSLDRGMDSAANEQLFTQELVQAGSVFEGTIRRIPAGSRERLAQALGSLHSIGRGKVHGWGQVHVEVRANPTWGTLAARAQDFRKVLREYLKKAKLDETLADHLVPLTLLSPLMPEDGADGAQAIANALGGSVLLRLRRFEREGGWDQRSGRMQPVQAVAAGAVFVIRVPRTVTDPVLLDCLAALEMSGSGARCHQGFGQLLGFDPFFLQRTMRSPTHQGGPPVIPSETHATPAGSDAHAPALTDPESQLRPYRKALVVNAEQVMETAFREGRINLNKSQLNHLVGICGQAEVDAEIKNYLRYQVGRGERTTGWSIGLVDAIISAADRAMQGLDDDSLRVSAWKLFATYLARAFTYQKEVQKQNSQSGGYRPGQGPADRGGRGGRP